MRKIAMRTSACLLLVLFMIGGFGIYLFRYILEGDRWVTFQVNRHAYSDAILSVGKVVDCNGQLLASMSKGQQTFSSSELTRLSTLHAVGDIHGNIGTGVMNYHATDMMGYSRIGGVYSHTGRGNTIQLSIDAKLNNAAYTALAGRKGAVIAYNYRTGEVLCMVSTPSYDAYYPLSPEQLEWSYYDGVYINRCISSTFTPGSIFKIVTLTAAIENIPELFDMTFCCEGHTVIANEVITCSSVHGYCDIYDAFAGSCNVAFAEIAQMLSGEILYEYALKLGLLESFKVSDIPVAAGSFIIAAGGSVDLSWSGIGQYEDLVNPLAMTRLMAAIANKGVAVNPRLITGIIGEYGMPKGLKYRTTSNKRLMASETAVIMAKMLRYNATSVYNGYYSFAEYPGFSGKSGTAEMKDGKDPHGWFTGFLADIDNPIAFTVIVENSGWGMQQAAPIVDIILGEMNI
ncbi:MAG: penicillin-binding transpeptidase domain-containing protein [Oscillospiraceae bacterium]|nr:penicillin-binding transpeptidase domain-containing protein [Oscillospiraceae bacterium]